MSNTPYGFNEDKSKYDLTELSSTVSDLITEARTQSGRVALFSGTAADGTTTTNGKTFTFADNHKLGDFDKVVIYLNGLHSEDYSSGSRMNTNHYLTIGDTLVSYPIISGTVNDDLEAIGSAIIELKGARLYNTEDGESSTLHYKATNIYEDCGSGSNVVQNDEDILKADNNDFYDANTISLVDPEDDFEITIIGYSSDSGVNGVGVQAAVDNYLDEHVGSGIVYLVVNGETLVATTTGVSE